MKVDIDEIKNKIITHYQNKHSEIILTIRIMEGLSKILADGIEKASDNMKWEDIEASIDNYLERDSILKFINDRQPNLEPIPKSVVKAVDEYFQDKKEYNVCHIYRISNHKDDDWKYSVTARKSDGKYACWSSWNSKRNSMNFGHYQLESEKACLDILNELYTDITGEPEKYGMLSCVYENPNSFANNQDNIQTRCQNNIIAFNRNRSGR
jgi:hypothetical protein